MNGNDEQINSWIKKGYNDFKSARTILKHSPDLTDIICFHSQQAAEKHLKALLVLTGTKEKKTHDLVYLLKLISKKIPVSDLYYEICADLTQYSVSIRYPMDIEEPSKEDAATAVKDTRKIIKWVKTLIKEYDKTLFG